MINPKTDLLPINQWNLKEWSIKAMTRVLVNGTDEQINHILDWSYSGCSAAFSEQLYAIAGHPYPYESNHAIPYPAI